ncbi:hypothetical protein GGR51DRAFT_554437 [Nemania sp. FL0031]|nr:hypothetical protein GGR51DRAFT_554437 [Nemania sp. FL0031]
MSQLLYQTKVYMLHVLYELEVHSINLEEYLIFFEIVDKEKSSSEDFKTIPIETFATIIIRAVEQMKSDPSATRPDIRNGLVDTIRVIGLEHTDWQDDAKLDGLIDSILRIWLMVEPIHMRAAWTGDQQALCDSVYSIFFPTKSAPSFEASGEGILANEDELATIRAEESANIQSRMTHDMTAANLKRLTKIKIYWTRSLNQNLEFDTEYRLLPIFGHNRWLFDTTRMVKKWQEEQLIQKRQRQSTSVEDPEGSNSPRSRNLPPFPIPLEVLEEAIKALNFLLPPYSFKTVVFLAKENNSLEEFRTKHYDELGNRTSGKVRFKEFVYYHDRLVELAYDFLNPPKDWGTVWRDYRNPAQYWTFWLGLAIFIAILVFGVLSSVLAGVQVYYAQHPPSG